jgi:hypothetical protein
VLGRHAISIASLIQHESGSNGPVSLVIMTHSCQPSAVQQALAEIDASEAVAGRSVCLPVLDDWQPAGRKADA